MNLNEKYSQNIFLDWIDELLPDFERDIKRVDVPKSFTDVSKIESLGKSSIGVMVFAIQMDSDPTRRRVSITKDSFNLLKNYSVQNAIIAYFCPSFGQWRLSLLTSTATWEDGRVISKLSNLKRQSFVLGVNAKTKTPTKYLAGKVTDLADLKKRFSIEVVNKDFYREISSAFNSLQTVLQLPSKEAKSQTNLEFSVRLIGRIIFCWFLREKRSEAGISLISDTVLSLDAVKNTKDYYHKLLEPLFFEVLNKPIESRNFDEFDKEPFIQTPYLNGGLFSAQYDDYYDRGRNDFQSKFHNTLVIPNSWFESLFETLETYHFTIDENTSYDEELSIDPEMLGRIFENLLAEINPETGESARKSTGSYYTPRVIVDYMVDESLTLYLKNKTNIDEEKIRAVISYDLDDDQSKPLTQTEKENIIDALGKLKILDPACGSGAFPMGALQKIVFILQQIDPNAEVMHSMDLKQTPPEFRRHIQEEFSAGNYDYLRKLRVIRESIYGVDIQAIATEISRLRCFLTLVVDQAIKDDKPDRGIKPLPNLDFKFVTANTLIGLPKNENGIQQMGIYDNREKIERLKEIIDDYFNSSGIEREQLKAKFAQEQKSLLREMEQEHGWSNIQKAELSNKLIDWEPFSHKAAEWFDPEWMFGIKEGFDIVIGNPPYVNVFILSKEKIDKSEYKRTYISAKGAFDLYILFMEFGIKMCNRNGLVAFITPNKYLSAEYAKSLRILICQRHQLYSFLDLSFVRVFGASVYPVISLITKEKQNNFTQLFSINEENQNVFIFKSSKIDTDIFTTTKDCNMGILLHPNSVSIYKKLNSYNKFSTVCDIGASFSVDESYKSLKLIHEYQGRNREFKFVISSNIDRYRADWGANKINYLRKPFLKPVLALDDKILSPLRNKQISEPKIIIAGMTKEIRAFYDEGGNYASGIPTILLTNININPLVLLGILNSSLINYYFHLMFGSLSLQGGYLRIGSPQIEQLPFVMPDSDDEQKLSDYVKMLIKNKGLSTDESISSNTVDLENKINQIVYKIYDLTSEETKIIENLEK